MKILALPSGELQLPAFLPDATRAVVRSIDSVDLERCGVDALVMNAYHLMQTPGSTTIKSLGGLHQMSAWKRPIMTDSGGFQIYSLIHQNPKYGKVTDRGATFTPDGTGREYKLTPEKSIQLQMGYGADILVCLDDCTHVDAPMSAQEDSVRRTVNWAKRCKSEFERLNKQKDKQRPLLFAVIQGGGNADLRRQCAEELLEIGFDGFGYGGWPLDSDNNLLVDMLALTRELVPPELPVHALGVGHPANVAACAYLGYPMFDSAMPTRDARNGRLYTFTSDESPATDSKGWFAYFYATDDKHIKDSRPVSDVCDCLTCQNYARGYLHHLYKLNDSLFPRLATIHNLRFMMQLVARLREGIGMSELDQLVETVRESAKYQHLSLEVIQRVGSLELAKYPRLKEAVKSTKNKLHQIGGAYLADKMPYARWLSSLEEAAPDRELLLAKCREIMPHHASTRERLPILDEFYQVTLADIAPVQSVIDIACGLNPLAIPWMPLEPNARYYAYDIYEDMIGFVQNFMNLIGVQGTAEAHDMGTYIPPQEVDLALILKTLPCLEQVDKQTSLRLLEGLNARHLLISYPVRSLGGSNKGMAENYEAHLERLLADKPWQVRRYEFKTELAFLVTKS